MLPNLPILFTGWKFITYNSGTSYLGKGMELPLIGHMKADWHWKIVDYEYWIRNIGQENKEQIGCWLKTNSKDQFNRWMSIKDDQGCCPKLVLFISTLFCRFRAHCLDAFISMLPDHKGLNSCWLVVLGGSIFGQRPCCNCPNWTTCFWPVSLQSVSRDSPDDLTEI